MSVAQTVPVQPASVAVQSVTHPTACTSWCKDRHFPVGHNHGPRDTAHRSPSLVLSSPDPRPGEDLFARAELFQLDELSDTGETVLYVEGETSFPLNGPEADIFIAQAQAWLDGLRVLRSQMH
jgi:hypothetical protein